MANMVEQFWAGGWHLVCHWPTKEEAEEAIKRYQRNNPGGRFRITKGRPPYFRRKGPMELAT